LVRLTLKQGAWVGTAVYKGYGIAIKYTRH